MQILLCCDYKQISTTRLNTHAIFNCVKKNPQKLSFQDGRRLSSRSERTQRHSGNQVEKRKEEEQANVGAGKEEAGL